MSAYLTSCILWLHILYLNIYWIIIFIKWGRWSLNIWLKRLNVCHIRVFPISGCPHGSVNTDTRGWTVGKYTHIHSRSASNEYTHFIYYFFFSLICIIAVASTDVTRSSVSPVYAEIKLSLCVHSSYRMIHFV